MRTELTLLENLGYSSDEIKSFAEAHAEGIIDCLAENMDNVCANMRYLLDDVGKMQLLKYIVFYSESFILPPDVFAKYIEKLKDCDDDWADTIYEQFAGYNGYSSQLMPGTVDDELFEPYLEIIASCDEEKIRKALDSIEHPSKREYMFIRKLHYECGIEVSTQDINEDDLKHLEIGKYELIENVNFLLKEGLSEDIIIRILILNALILTYQKQLLIDELTDLFGSNYVEHMNTMIEEDENDEFDDIIMSV